MIHPLFIFLSVLRTLTGHKAGIKSLDFHPYGEYVASGSMDCNVKVSEMIVHIQINALDVVIFLFILFVLTFSVSV